jgi:hypothetical protein
MVLNTMQYIRTKQAEEKWSLHQYNFLAGSRKIVPLGFRSEYWIKIPTQSSRRLQELAYLRIFLSILLAEPKDCIFRHQFGPKWKQHILTSKPGHTVVTALRMAVSKSAKTIVGKISTTSFAASDTACLIHPHRTLDVYWPII